MDLSLVARYCLGLPESERRPLDSEETDRASRWLNWVRLRVYFGVLWAPLLAVGLVVYALSSQNFETRWSLGLVAVLLFFAVEPAMLYIHANRFTWMSQLRQDLHSGLALEFAADPTAGHPETAIDPRTGAPLQLPKRVALLERSQVLLYIDGKRMPELAIAPIAVATERSTGARIAAEWLEPVITSEGIPLLLGDRELSAEEQQEIRAHLKGILRDPLICVVIAAIFTLPVLFTENLRLEDMGGSIWLILALGFLFQRLWVRQKFVSDLNLARVVIVREHDAPGVASLPHEFLPISHVSWTEAGRPALWRRVHGPE